MIESPRKVSVLGTMPLVESAGRSDCLEHTGPKRPLRVRITETSIWIMLWIGMSAGLITIQRIIDHIEVLANGSL
jgi:hypothetical protein